jgi:hypothetical protein
VSPPPPPPSLGVQGIASELTAFFCWCVLVLEDTAADANTQTKHTHV